MNKKKNYLIWKSFQKTSQRELIMPDGEGHGTCRECSR